MKKILFFMAAAALSFTACTSDDTLEQNAQQAATENIGVGFDVYVPGATAQTRAGRVNVVNNTVLQQTGFGLYAYQTDNEGYTAGAQAPNYMWNQQVYFNETASGWYYAPLKYWPNETTDDSQILPTNPAGMPEQVTLTHNLDKLSFFAYAPWVSANQSTGLTSPINTDIEATTALTGIYMLTNTDGKLGTYFSGAVKDPLVYYITAENPDESVDLLWGVAPAGGLNYTSVSKTNGNVTIPEGMPLKNLIKPAVNTNLKFMFQHALARLGVKIVLAADQVAAGGVFDYGNTKVTVEKIEIKGNFGTKGQLNMNNSVANVANWVWKNTATGEGINPVLTIEAGKGLAPHLIYNATLAATPAQQEVTGVTTTLADALKVSATKGTSEYKYSTLQTKPAYSPTTPYFAAEFDNAVTPTPTYATYAHSDEFAKSSDSLYFHKFLTDNVSTNNEAYTDITNEINTTYPTATVFENIYAIKKPGWIHVSSPAEKVAVATKTAYRLAADGKTYVPTGHEAEIGDYVLQSEGTNPFKPVTLKATDNNYYTAYPNYFMIIPTQAMGNGDLDKADRTLKVKITYYVSTKDASLKDGIVYTKNEVEKDIVLPHLKNGIAYNLKLILGMTSVKVEAEVADWVTTEGVINLPQNTSE